jgi:hypothetical protein
MSPFLRFHNNCRQFYIVDSYMYVNKNKKGRHCCDSNCLKATQYYVMCAWLILWEVNNYSCTQEIPSIVHQPKYYHCVLLTVVPILSQMHPIHTHPSHAKLRFIYYCVINLQGKFG